MGAFALTLLAADCIYYWKHRSEHSVRLLWAYHSVHHSSEEYNLTTAFRLPWFGAILGLLFYVPLVLIGFNPVAVLLNKVVLEYIPKYGKKLADEVRKWGTWIKQEAEKELAEFYPRDSDGATPIVVQSRFPGPVFART